ncbi:23S rRNA (pseudouridine(1915)-N(3))-methyltransferase RlmH [Pseudopelagicola sp. nBUS_20]|uniref:23S rRNA (pseudouridine(1915)-N(3))-methyltransferase RlmH n=1 Tax=Pseudopelagicola sp. nBUS_20 TaxID=3395317 RepID=UPI003EBE8D60
MALKVHICAVGRLRSRPELDMLNDYLVRFDRTGRRLGLGPAIVNEVDDRRGGGKTAEADLLRGAVPRGAIICVLDERGKLMSSPEFAGLLGQWRDDGQSDVAFLIGGADGIDPGLFGQADAILSFGKMVWPHMLARVMLGEQLYRSASILAGAPYHRA